MRKVEAEDFARESRRNPNSYFSFLPLDITNEISTATVGVGYLLEQLQVPTDEEFARVLSTVSHNKINDITQIESEIISEFDDGVLHGMIYEGVPEGWWCLDRENYPDNYKYTEFFFKTSNDKSLDNKSLSEDEISRFGNYNLINYNDDEDLDEAPNVSVITNKWWIYFKNGVIHYPITRIFDESVNVFNLYIAESFDVSILPSDASVNAFHYFENGVSIGAFDGKPRVYFTADNSLSLWWEAIFLIGDDGNVTYHNRIQYMPVYDTISNVCDSEGVRDEFSSLLLMTDRMLEFFGLESDDDSATRIEKLEKFYLLYGVHHYPNTYKLTNFKIWAIGLGLEF